ncbi:glycosyltransferase [Reichenbachiella sp. MALMAid0571]|uniref:glycosyltransferase n=1 Tax=Reichenbachiella sp. MALMAid0571 TaxID=3143939 RepID=UPI0032DEDBBD
MLILESNVHSVVKLGAKEVAKRIFLSRIHKVFASGVKHKLLLELLNYNGEIVVTNGVGLIGSFEGKTTKPRTNSFLFVGRLASEKNLRTLIEIFNELPYELNVIGEGPDERELKSIANTNINFLGYVKNVDLANYYKSHKSLILISVNEPWGLVAEESLYFGTPVIVSSVCGIVDTLCFHEKNSLVVEATSKDDIRMAVEKMMNVSLYEKLSSNCTSEIIKKNQRQVETYVQNISKDKVDEVF